MTDTILNKKIYKRKHNLAGMRFGRLLVLSAAQARITKSGKRVSSLWNCQCDCGGTIATTSNLLQNGRSVSCGCVRKEAITKHGQYKTKAYCAWAKMLARCRNPNDPRYKDYGGRGIFVCERWLSFENFLSDMGHPLAHLSLERNDNSASYCPENCAWVDAKTQMNNTRKNVFLEYGNKRQTLSQWARELGFSRELLRKRYKLGWPTHKILFTPISLSHSRKPASVTIPLPLP